MSLPKSISQKMTRSNAALSKAAYLTFSSCPIDFSEYLC